MEASCILQCGDPCSKRDSIDKITSSKWKNIEDQSKKWDGLDTFGSVYTTVDWKRGPTGLSMHDSCYLKLCTPRKLTQAENRKKKQSQNVVSEDESSFNSSTSVTDESFSSPPPKRTRSAGTVHDKEKCIWCFKGPDKKHPDRKSSKLHLISSLRAWSSFKRHTILLKDDEMRARIVTLIDFIDSGTDPFAIEVRYHHSCWQEHVSHPVLSDEDHMHLQNVSLIEAKYLFFRHVQKVIFEEHEIRTLQSLLKEYVSIMENYNHNAYGVKSSFLKTLLIREYGDNIGFHVRHQKNESEVVYDKRNSSSYVEAAISCMGITDESIIKGCAKRLVGKVKEKDPLAWPPKISQLEEPEVLDPLLVEFVSCLRTPKVSSPERDPLVLSLASALTSFITKQRTKTLINNTVTLHGITRSKELVEIFNKQGFGISYADILHLRDWWALCDLEIASICPPDLGIGKPGIQIVDNDDFRNDTLTGAGTSHLTNVMYIQHTDVVTPTENIIVDSENISERLKVHATRLKKVEPYKTVKRGEPTIKEKPISNFSESVAKQRKRGVIHTLARMTQDGERPRPLDQRVPSYNGFHASFSQSPIVSRPYYHKSYDKPPTKSVLHANLCETMEAAELKNMPFVVICGDLPVYSLLVELCSENEEKFSKILPWLGQFHLEMSMMNAIYKRYRGSELDELLVIADAVAAGSVDQALKGKHYRRGLRCLRAWYECLLFQLLKDKYVNLTYNVQEKLDILRSSGASIEKECCHEELMELDEVNDLITGLFSSVTMSDMAEFWKDFLSMCDALFLCIHANHCTNAFQDLIDSQRAMLPWLTIYDNNQYSRWLPYFWSVLTNLPRDRESFLEENYAHSLTGNPYSGMSLDMIIEVTMNKGSKLKSGWLSILKNEKQLLVHSRNCNNIARIRNAVHRHIGTKKGVYQHTESSPRRLKADEQVIQDLLKCCREFECFPFDPAVPTLRTLQSAIPASDKLIADLKSAYADGEAKLMKFLEERIFTKVKSLFESVPKNKRLTFANEKKETSTSGKDKVTTRIMESVGLAAIIEIVERSGLVNLSEILQYRITEESLSVFNANGTFRKVQKSKLIQKLNLLPIDPGVYVAIVDMGMIWRMSTPTREDREKSDATVYTWGDFVNKIINLLISRHQLATKIIMVNDPYNLPYSIKDDERDRRKQGNSTIPRVFPKLKEKFPSVSEFNTFLTSDENKTRLQQLIKNELIRVGSSISRELIYSCGEVVGNVSKNQEISDFKCNQFEADTIMFSIYHNIRLTDKDTMVVIDATDTDCYAQAAAISKMIKGPLAIKRKGQLISCDELCPPNLAEIMIQFYTMTGCDANNGFYGHGKNSVYDKINRISRLRNLITDVGKELPLSDSIRKMMKTFVIQAIYGDNKSETPGEARSVKWKSMKKKSTLRLCPDDDTLDHYCERANYLSYIQLHPEIYNHPSPIGLGWMLVDGRCRPVRNRLPALPNNLKQPVDIDGVSSSSDSESDESEYSSSDEMFLE